MSRKLLSMRNIRKILHLKHSHDCGIRDIHKAQIFIAAIGASNCTYAEASLSQKVEGCPHLRAVVFFEGVPEAVGEKRKGKKGEIYFYTFTPANSAL